MGTGIPNSLINTIAFVDDTVYFGGEFNFAGNKHSSNIACWRPVLYSSVESNTEYKKSEIYEIIPNPADNIMKIRYDNTNIHSIVISDYLGKTIEKFYPLSKNEVIEETQISTEHFSSGLYYLTFLKANNSISLPFSVIH
ncbi:MAG: T9SS type A sorting domain-containing protein [Ignavibacteria bacterium]|nr:T9SS type A sorting domain-containing protein [Ignavibacteria bacterium]